MKKITNPVQISENCWKHIGGGCVFYTKTIERKSEYHREDGPAIEWSNGTKEWYFEGKLHRLDGPAVEFANGDKEWWINGRRHREDGPAIELIDGYKAWLINGKLHRLAGPAIEYTNENTSCYYKGTHILFKDNLKLRKTLEKNQIFIENIAIKNGNINDVVFL